MGALRGSDGAFLLGVMGAHTAMPGMIYFPAGLPDLERFVGRAVDLAGNVRREVGEETGLAPDDFEAEPGWTTVLAGPRIAQMKMLHAARPRPRCADASSRISRGRRSPELADIRIVRGAADLDPMMPPFVTAFLTPCLEPGHEAAPT